MAFLKGISDPRDANEIRNVLREAGQAREMRIVVADYSES